MGYLSKRSFDELRSLEGRKIAKIVYYLWDNLQSDDDFKSLDWIGITLHDGTNTVLNYGVDNDGIEVVDFDFNEELNKIETQFKGQVTLIHENATLDRHWFPILDKVIKRVSFGREKGENGNSQIIFEFSDKHKIEIFTKEEGMGVDFFEA
ncbi:MAG: hypothetical protein ABFR62_10715 [Bacteroidota bacterium]